MYVVVGTIQNPQEKVPTMPAAAILKITDLKYCFKIRYSKKQNHNLN